jgi:hypothetical protein
MSDVTFEPEDCSCSLPSIGEWDFLQRCDPPAAPPPIFDAPQLQINPPLCMPGLTESSNSCADIRVSASLRMLDEGEAPRFTISKRDVTPQSDPFRCRALFKVLLELPSQTPGGSDGTVWYVNSGGPSNNFGDNNDLYLDTTTGNVYQNNGDNTWTLVANIQGPQGAPGTGGTGGGGDWVLITGARRPDGWYPCKASRMTVFGTYIEDNARAYARISAPHVGNVGRRYPATLRGIFQGIRRYQSFGDAAVKTIPEVMVSLGSCSSGDLKIGKIQNLIVFDHCMDGVDCDAGQEVGGGGDWGSSSSHGSESQTCACGSDLTGNETLQIAVSNVYINDDGPFTDSATMTPAPAPGGGMWYEGKTYGTVLPLSFNGHSVNFLLGCPASDQPLTGWHLIPWSECDLQMCGLTDSSCDPMELTFEFQMECIDPVTLESTFISGTVSVTE